MNRETLERMEQKKMLSAEEREQMADEFERCQRETQEVSQRQARSQEAERKLQQDMAEMDRYEEVMGKTLELYKQTVAQERRALKFATKTRIMSMVSEEELEHSEQWKVEHWEQGEYFAMQVEGKDGHLVMDTLIPKSFIAVTK
jgi:hypothetical protein